MAKWLRDPPCTAEIYLENLFATGKIEPNDTANKIKNEHSVFKDFSQAVFRNNFKRHRELNGLGLGK